MSVLVFGHSGQLARSLQQIASERGEPWHFLGRAQADLADPAVCAEAIHGHRPRAVVNAAAWTAVDAAEGAEAEATIVNGAAPRAMADACAALDLPLLHISSDYVFDGRGDQPWKPEDPLAPLGAYGRSKALGELGIRESGARAIILRTSWVFSSFGSNFVKTMLRLGRERSELSVVDDQVGGPTSAPALAGAVQTLTEALLAGEGGGTYHFCEGPYVSWADFAAAIMATAHLPCEIKPIPSSAYPTAAPRPLNSRLDCHALHQRFAVPATSWRDSMAAVVNALEAQDLES